MAILAIPDIVLGEPFGAQIRRRNS